MIVKLQFFPEEVSYFKYQTGIYLYMSLASVYVILTLFSIREKIYQLLSKNGLDTKSIC